MTTLTRGRTTQPIRRTEVIHGRSYVVEVLPVDHDRWRARLVQQGTTNALMPFYGETPDEAVARLVAWLSRVGRPAAQRL